MGGRWFWQRKYDGVKVLGADQVNCLILKNIDIDFGKYSA